MAITVKIVRVPGAVTELMLNDNATVNDALNAASVEPGPNETISMDGNAVSRNASVYDGARVIVSVGAKAAS